MGEAEAGVGVDGLDAGGARGGPVGEGRGGRESEQEDEGGAVAWRCTHVRRRLGGVVDAGERGQVHLVLDGAVDEREGGFDLGEAAQRAVEIGIGDGGAAGVDQTVAERLERGDVRGLSGRDMQTPVKYFSGLKPLRTGRVPRRRRLARKQLAWSGGSVVIV